MKITEFNNPHLIHAATLKYDESSPSLIDRDWHIGVDRNPGVVYFITVNDEIYKVGGSTQHIKSLVSQYILNLTSKAEPQFTRFPIYLMMVWLLSRGYRIDYYYMNVVPYKIHIPNMLTGGTVEVIVNDFHGFETGCIQHVTDINGDVPKWNIAESDYCFNEGLRVLFENRLLKVKTNQSELFDYDEFLSTEWNFL